MCPSGSIGGRDHRTMSPRRSDATTGRAAERSDDASEAEPEECEPEPVEILYTAARTVKLLLGALVSALTALKLLGVL